MGISELLIALVALTAMEIVLGIDNIVFIAIISSRLPKEQQPKARRVGLILAMVTRLALLCSLGLVLQLDGEIFRWSQLGIPETWFSDEANAVSWRDLILLAGGLFLIGKSVVEIHAKLEGSEHSHDVKSNVTFKSVITQIAILDIVFSLDSVITAVGMVQTEGNFLLGIGVMSAAVIIAIAVMLIFAEKVSAFVEKNPTIKMLALSFLILIGVMLVAEGAGTHVNKGYIYFAMVFSLIVEFLNMRYRNKRTKKGAPEPAPEAGK